MSFVLRMAWRETRASWARLGFFFLCVGLGVASIIALRSVVQHVRTTLTSEARALVGADVVLQSQRPFSDAQRARVTDRARTAGLLGTAEMIDTQTMVSPIEGQGNGNVKLVELRGVEAGFPFYGAVELQDGSRLERRHLADGGVVVQPELLVALDLSVGDALRLAGRTFTIRGALARDRVQGGGGIAFGPRVYVDLAALQSSSLLGFGSRATYRILLRIEREGETQALVDQLRAALRGQFVQVRSWQTLEDRIGRNLTTAENYLSLVGFAIVVLGGLGVWSVTRVIVQQKIRSVAILKCLGAASGPVLAIYLLQILGLAAGGSLIGVALAGVALMAIPASLLEPLGVASVWITRSAAAQGVAVGVLVSVLFALVPLLEVRRVKPLLLLRAHTADQARARDWQSWTAASAIGILLALVAIWQAGSLLAGAYVFLGLAAIAAVLFAGSRWLVRLARPLAQSRAFVVRHAAISLGRPGNQTRVILMAVGLGCFFIVAVRATQGSLLTELSTQVGERSPDLVLIDIQRDQVEPVSSLVRPYLRAPARITPLMRGRVASVDGRTLRLPSVEAVREHRRLAREFGLTFRTHVEPNERLIEGRFWDGPLPAPLADGVDTEVSVEEEVWRGSGLSLGDRVTFDVAGALITARVTSVRTVEWENSQNGGFVFVLRPAPPVQRAPHSYVGFLQVVDDSARRGALQRDLVRAHPNVSVIDVRDIVASIAGVVANVTLGVTVVGAVTLIGGTLILIGAVALTKFQRLYETAIYRTLGASARLVGLMTACEYGLLGTLAGVLGTAGGLALSWVLAVYLFDIDWQPGPWIGIAGVVLTAMLVTTVGVLSSVDVLLRKPLGTLRSE
jgi:putative ABC transport system permease protein